MADAAVRLPRGGGRTVFRAARRHGDAAQSAPRRSSRPARSACSTRCSTGSPKSASAVGSGRGSGISRPSPTCTARTPTTAIARLQDQLVRHRSVADGRLGAWSTVVGHTTCSRSAVAGGPGARRRARRRDELPHVARQDRSRRVHRRVRPAADGPPRRTRHPRATTCASPTACTSTTRNSTGWRPPGRVSPTVRPRR